MPARELQNDPRRYRDRGISPTKSHIGATKTAANPDKEILDAARPALATTGGLLVVHIVRPMPSAASFGTPIKRDYGPAGDPRILIAKARVTRDQPELVGAHRRSRLRARPGSRVGGIRREFPKRYWAIFITRETLDAASRRACTVRAPIGGVAYFAFADPSGGSSDSFMRWRSATWRASGSFSISSASGSRRFRLRAPSRVRKRPQAISPSEQFAAIDMLADGPPRLFRVMASSYQPSDLNRSEIYLATLPPLINSGKASACSTINAWRRNFSDLERQHERAAAGTRSITLPAVA